MITASQAKLLTPDWIGKIAINRARLNPFELRPEWTDYNPDHVEEIFFQELTDRRQLKKNGRKAPDGLTPHEWLRVTCYQAILAWLTVDEGDELFDRLEHRFVRGTQKADRDIFQRGIVAVFSKRPTLISVRDRERLAAPMWYAFRHYIPPYLLIGFNTQYPGHLAGGSAWRKQIESSLDEWVVEQRFAAELRDCPLEHFRQRYPKRIEDALADKRKRQQADDEEW